MSQQVEDISCEELRRIVRRDRSIMDTLSQRLTAMTMENATLLALAQELQQEVNDLRQSRVEPEPEPVAQERPAPEHNYTNADHP